jgi:nitroreductase
MTAGAAEIQLPPPQTEGGIGVFEALKKRSSTEGGDFSAAELSPAELSTILWAASGLNRGEKGWTVPMARGMAPYCKVYVAGSNGVWLYDWASHSLKEISPDNVKAKIGSQAFVRRASHLLILVADPEVLKVFPNPEVQAEFANVLAGAMTQNVYLAAASLKLGARYIHRMDLAATKEALALGEGERPICLMMVGK